MPQESARRQLTLAGALAIWAALLLLGAFYGTWLGFGGKGLTVTLAASAFFLSGEIFLAARGVKQALCERLGSRGAVFALLPLAVYLFYAAGVGVFDWRHISLGAAFTLVPAFLVFAAGARAPGDWADYLAVIAIWIPVEVRWLYWLFPYPLPLRHTLTILLAVNTALAAFLFTRRLDGIGYSVEWGPGFMRIVGLNFGMFIAIAIPLGLKLGFLTWAPSLTRVRSLPIAAIGILCFTAWPEEFLFRGLLQNLLARTLHSPWAGLAAASLIFGAAHLNNGGFPNWRYGILASVAGFFYGRAWMKSGSLFASCLVHAAVDIGWHVLFK